MLQIFGGVSKRRSNSHTLQVTDDNLSLSSRRSSTSKRRGSSVSFLNDGPSPVPSQNHSVVHNASVQQINGLSEEEDKNATAKQVVNNTDKDVCSSARFTCPLCKRQLSEPRVLPCLHAFCTACLRELDGDSSAAGSQHSLWNNAENEGERNEETKKASPSVKTPPTLAGYEHEEPTHDNTVIWSPLRRATNGSTLWKRNNTQGSSSGLNTACIIVCPTCGSEARIPSGGVLMFPLHHVLQHRMWLATLAKDAAAASNEPILCDLCSTDVHATSRCSDCLLSLCTFCSEAHQRQRRTAAHEVLPLQEAKLRRNMRQQVCPVHSGQEIRFFCESCGQVACRECCITLHKDHRPPCEPISRHSAPYISAIRDALERARPLAEGVQSAFERLRLLEARVQNKAASVQDEVDAHIDSWLEAMEAHRRSLTVQVRKARESKLQAIRCQQLDLERRTGDVSSTVKFADELLTEGSEIEIMSTAVQLLRRLDWCLTGGTNAINVSSSNSSSSSSATELQVPRRIPTVTRVSDYLQFLPNEISGRSTEGLPLYGVVTTQICSASHCRIGIDALNTCRQHRRVEVTLITRDGENQPIGHGGADVFVEVRARDPTRRPLNVDIDDKGDGTYMISFLPDAAGSYIMTVHVQNKPIHGSPFHVYVRPLRPHSGVFHCCTFCSSNGKKDISCGCGATMQGGFRGCGHGHTGHPGRRHWSCCGSVLESSECGRGTASSASVFQFSV